MSDKQPKTELKQIKTTLLFQDENYTFMRNKEVVTQEDIFNLPLHMILIACGMLDARTYVPRVGKQGYLKTMKKLKKQFDENYKKQCATAVEIQKNNTRMVK